MGADEVRALDPCQRYLVAGAHGEVVKVHGRLGSAKDEKIVWRVIMDVITMGGIFGVVTANGLADAERVMSGPALDRCVLEVRVPMAQYPLLFVHQTPDEIEALRASLAKMDAWLSSSGIDNRPLQAVLYGMEVMPSLPEGVSRMVEFRGGR